MNGKIGITNGGAARTHGSAGYDNTFWFEQGHVQEGSTTLSQWKPKDFFGGAKRWERREIHNWYALSYWDNR